MSNLESLNGSLEKAKSQVELKHKKVLQEKEQACEKIEDLLEEIDSLKQIRTQQEQQIKNMIETQEKLAESLEIEQKNTNEYKNKLATYICNTNALQKELISKTPKTRDDQNVHDKLENIETPVRQCKTVETEMFPESPNEKFDQVLEKLDRMIGDSPPDVLLNWCKSILGNENYVLRYDDDESVLSEESKINIDEVSVISETNNQEISYKAHLKLSQQNKNIENLLNKLKEKRQRAKVSKQHIKALQQEIKNLDLKLATEKNLNIDYLKATLVQFASKAQGLDTEAFTILQLIFSQLGLNPDTLTVKEEKKRWGLFKKSKNKT